MEYILLFLSIFLSLTSLFVSAFLFVKIERLLDNKVTSEKSLKKNKDFQKKASDIKIKEGQKKKYKDYILKAEKKYFKNLTSFIGLFFLVTGLLFFSGYAFSQITPFIRFILLNFLSIILLITGFTLQRKNKANLSIVLKTLSGAVLLFAAIGSSRIQLLQWTDNEFFLLAITLLSVIANVLIAYVKSYKNSDKIHFIITLFALSFYYQNTYIFVISAVLTFIAVIVSLKRKDLMAIYLISFMYYCYQLSILLFADNIDPIINNVGIFSNIIVVLPLLIFINIKDEIISKFFISFLLYSMNWVLFFLTIYQYSINKQVKEAVIITSTLILYIVTKKILRPIYQYLQTVNILVIIILVLYAIFSLKDFYFQNGLIVCLSIIFLYFMLLIESNDRKIFNLISVINIIFSVILFYLILIHDNSVNSELVNYGIIAIVFGIGFNIYKTIISKSGDFNSKLWFILGLLPSLIFSALVITTNFSFRNYLLWGVVLLFSTIISFGLKKSSLKYGLVLSVFVYCVNGYCHFEAYQDIISSLYYFLPFIIIPLINLFYYSENNDSFCRFVSMFTFFSSFIWFSYKILFPISAPLPGVIYLLLSVITFEIGDLVSRTKIKLLFRLKNSFYLWGGILSWLFVIFHLAVILNSEKYFDYKGFHFQVRLFIEITSILVFMYYSLSRKEISNFIISRFYNLNIEILVFLIILTVKSQIQRIYHSPIWVLISFLIYFGGKYIIGNPWRLKLYSIIFCLASMIQTAFYLGVKVSVDGNFYNQGWFLGIISIVSQCLFIVTIRQNKYLEDSDISINTGIISKMKEQIQLKYDRSMYYILFVCIALYIASAFDKSIHSLLWLIESFVIYIVGIIHKDKKLRMISVTVIFFCVFRMIIVDLKEQNLIIKSSVFFIAGILLILINMIYNKKVYSNEN